MWCVFPRKQVGLDLIKLYKKNLLYTSGYNFLIMKLLFTLRKDIDVKFLATSGESSLPANYIETEDILKKLKLERTHVTEDMQREQELLDLVKINLSAIL